MQIPITQDLAPHKSIASQVRAQQQPHTFTLHTKGKSRTLFVTLPANNVILIKNKVTSTIGHAKTAPCSQARNRTWKRGREEPEKNTMGLMQNWCQLVLEYQWKLNGPKVLFPRCITHTVAAQYCVKRMQIHIHVEITR